MNDVKDGVLRRAVMAPIAGVLAGALLLTGVGCSTSTETVDSTELTLQENAELRERIAEIEASLAFCQDENDALSGQNSDLASALTQAQADLQVANATSRPAAAAQPMSAFGNIEGAEIFQRGDSIVVAVAGDVLFSSGRASLKNDAKKTLDRIASVLNATYPGQVVRVEGYTDNDPIRKSKWSSNEHLSAERSLTVEKYLVSRGVNNDRIYAAAFGPSNP
ncbi:MAG: OmpA family protein, partial [Planctomycetota bacterium]